MKKNLGDSHNQGKRVYLENNRVFKPRAVFWENLLLSDESKLRVFLNHEFNKRNLTSPFLLAPNLRAEFSGPFSGSIDFLEVTELPPDFQVSAEQTEALGAMLGLCFWLGIGDLHSENLMIGLKEGRLICFPIDIENLFDHLTHLQQTLLIPCEKVAPSNCGLSKIWSKLEALKSEQKLELLKAFAVTINVLNELSLEIIQTITSLPDFEIYPIRMIVRDTQKYREALKNQNFSGFYESEVGQLLQGDVPYYFRYPQSRKIYHLSKDGEIASDFATSDFDLSEPNEVSVKNVKSFLKLKTALLSINFLAKGLGLKSGLVKLNLIHVECSGKTISIGEEGGQIRLVCS